jgi:pyruvate-formate lyase-activating enzyme
MDTAVKLDIEKVTYELRCMMIRSEDLEKDVRATKEHINEYGMKPETELRLARLELLIERHELDKKEKRMELMFLYKKSLKNVKQG